jgi:ABC-type antimicrobial peptide transport system ATPase subunit
MVEMLLVVLQEQEDHRVLPSAIPFFLAVVAEEAQGLAVAVALLDQVALVVADQTQTPEALVQVQELHLLAVVQ